MSVTPIKRWFLWSLIIVFLFVAAPVWAGEEGVVTGSVVNVRTGPGTSYGVVTKVEAGQWLAVLEKSGDWLKALLHNGQEGWIHKDYIDVKTVLKKVTVNANNVNVRNGPGTQYSKVGQVGSGVLLSVFEEKNDWYLVNVPQVGQAWIAGWLTVAQDSQIVKTVMVTTEVLNVRSGPGTNYSLVTKIGLNEKHPVVAQIGGWYKIRVGNQEGWVSADYVKPVEGEANIPGETTPPPSGQEQIIDTVIVTGNIVNVRSANSLDAPVQAKTYAGERLAVLEKKGDWLRVQLNNGTKGWIAAWLAIAADGSDPSRGSVQESEALIAPISEGKTFRILDSGGRAVLVLEGWANNQYQIKANDAAKTLTLTLDGPTERDYQGKITRLGITNIRIRPQNNKAVIELAFASAPVYSVAHDSAKLLTRINMGGVQTQDLKGKVIVVDPGHASIQPGGWLDPGALGKRTGLKEKDVTLSIALKLKGLLEGAGAAVVMTHTGSTNLSLAGRAAIANNINADIFVSIHANYSLKNGVSGHSTYYYAPLSSPVLYAQRAKRQKLASCIQIEMVRECGRIDLGVMQENFAVLRETRVPSVLVETAFLSDTAEEALLANDSFRQKLAYGIFKGIVKYFE